jgi:hypothetical protein
MVVCISITLETPHHPQDRMQRSVLAFAALIIAALIIAAVCAEVVVFLFGRMCLGQIESMHLDGHILWPILHTKQRRIYVKKNPLISTRGT